MIKIMWIYKYLQANFDLGDLTTSPSNAFLSPFTSPLQGAIYLHGFDIFGGSSNVKSSKSSLALKAFYLLD